MDMISYVMGQKSAGGGGSSDFSTAEVTFVNNGGEGTLYEVQSVTHYNPGNDTYISFNVEVSDTSTIKTILYKGSTYIPKMAIVFADFTSDIELSGNVSIVGEGFATAFMITGDCSIGLTGESVG